MEVFILKLKTRSGILVIKSDSPITTIGDLKTELQKAITIDPTNLCVLCGFPPKKLDLDADDKTLLESNITSGDTLIVEEKESEPDKIEPQEENASKPDKDVDLAKFDDELFGGSGTLLKKLVPADNSCLFTSIGFVFGGVVDVSCGNFLRRIIAEEVKRDQVNYNEAILGKPNDEYCEWILRPDSWGGAIELAVLSKYFGLEIAVVDTVNAIINHFGEDQLYDHRVFLFFDGVHYDPLYRETIEGNGQIQTIFPIADDIILREAELLAIEAKAKRQFTDLNRFTLQCKVCEANLVGQNEAVDHAKKTGHSKFGEIKN